jgi:hypothetical protein
LAICPYARSNSFLSDCNRKACTSGDGRIPDKCSLDLFWLRDESLEDSASLPDPHILAQEIADDLRSALGQIEDILGDLEVRAAKQTQTQTMKESER